MDILKTIAGLIKHRLFFYDEHYPMVIVGYPGVGKSSTGLALAEAVDETFDVERVAFKPSEFFEIAKNIERGQAIMFDEAGIGLHAREWQTTTNIIFSKLTQIYRFLNVFVVFTVPDINYIDSHARNEMKAILELTHKDIHDEVVVGHWWVVKRNRAFGITNYEKLKIYDNGDPIEIDPVKLPRPSKRLWKAYKRKSETYKKNILDELYEELQKLEEGVVTKGIDKRTVRRLINEEKALIRAYEYFSKELGMSDRQIAGVFGVSHVTLLNWKSIWNSGSNGNDKEISQVGKLVSGKQ